MLFADGPVVGVIAEFGSDRSMHASMISRAAGMYSTDSAGNGRESPSKGFVFVAFHVDLAEGRQAILVDEVIQCGGRHAYG